MAQNHTFISEVTADPSQFTPIDVWIVEKIGEEKGTIIIGAGNKGGSPEFSCFYDVWINEFKITHTIQEEGKTDIVFSYKDTTPERLEFATNCVKIIEMGGKL